MPEQGRNKKIKYTPSTEVALKAFLLHHFASPVAPRFIFSLTGCFNIYKPKYVKDYEALSFIS